MPLLKPFANVLSPSLQMLPSGSLDIDWTHPIANGLLSCHVPGIMGTIDLVTGQNYLSKDGSPIFGLSRDGPALISNGTNTGGMSGTAPAALLNLPSISIFLSGYQGGAATQFSHPLGISYDSVPNDPYLYIAFTNNTTANVWQLEFNSGGPGFYQSTSGFTYTQNADISLGGTFNSVSGNAYLYGYGVEKASLTGLTSAAQAGSTARFILMYEASMSTQDTAISCNIACFWGRELSHDEMAQLDREPFCFLVPAEYELPALYVSGAAETITMDKWWSESLLIRPQHYRKTEIVPY